LAIQHVGNPSERMPVTGIATPKRPGNVLPCQSSGNMRVISNVLVIINGDEFVASNGQITKQGKRRKRQTESECQLSVG